MFHVHVDAIEMDSEFEKDLVERLKFYRVNYSIDRHSVDLSADSPEHEYHLTLKTDSSKEFKKISTEVFRIIESQNPIQRGYIECEFVAVDDHPESAPYRNVSVPFHLTMRPPEPGAFRQSELHVTLSRDESDHRLREALHHEMKMLSGFIPKEWGIAQIFTAQGTQEQINEIRGPLIDYLHSAGGAVHCSIKEERTVSYWMSHQDGIGLPYVIDQILRGE